MQTSAKREHAYLRRSFVVVVAACLWSMLVAHALATRLDAPSFVTAIAACAAFLTPVVVARVLLRRRIDRRRAAMEEPGGVRCLYCFYDLGKSPETGRCPECGCEYRRDLVLRAWRQVESSQEGALRSGGD